MIVNDPRVLAEVQEAFGRYETALMANDLAGMDACFWHDDKTIRYGIAEILHGIGEIRAYRQGRSPAGLHRVLSRTVITTFGSDCATASTLFEREAQAGMIGRQQQTWVRLEAGWRIVAAHVSVVPVPAAAGAAV
ncbi:oxalurate catabolism protein HpxZ [Xylophilus rhododendri]|uniref:Oxalurate catabolism protein HpxZ n=1 Tax=Xylophilus rhododendri TaxID=2697032 RepID=A0A857J5Y4_9BURK|nr:oxalurate catabolism protein HpxZ [Xylophilus rhododendri]QHI99127.1 oxalurate catabolism protein HpxZ [Xylophilus rhododendri]